MEEFIENMALSTDIKTAKLSANNAKKNTKLTKEVIKHIDSLSARSLNEKEIQNISIEEVLKTITINFNVLEELRDMILVGGESDYAQAYAGVSRANTEALKILAEFANTKSKNKTIITSREIDAKGKLDAERIRQETAFKIAEESTTTNNNILIMNREEVFDRLFPKKEMREVREIREVKEVKEINYSNDES